MGELSILSDDLNVITAEINSYKNVAGQAIYEIGIRLKKVKDTDLAKGRFWDWANKNCGFDASTATRLVQTVEQFGLATSQVSTSKLFEMLTLPEEIERAGFIEQKHTVPSTGEEKTVNEMTVRELREVKKALKEAESLAEQAKRSEQIAIKRLEEAENKPPEVVEKVIERVVQDERKVNSLEADIQRQQKQLADVIAENELIKKRMRSADVKKEDFKRLERDIQQLNAKRSDLEQDLEDIKEITKYIMKIEEIKAGGMAPVAYSNAIRRQQGSGALMNRLESALSAVEDWCKEMRKHTNKHSVIIEAEVIQ